MIRTLEVAFEGVGVISGRQEGWKFNFSFKKVVSVVPGEEYVWQTRYAAKYRFGRNTAQDMVKNRIGVKCG